MAKSVPSEPGRGSEGDDGRRDGAPHDASSDDVSARDASVHPETPRSLWYAGVVTLVEAVALGGGGIYWLIRSLLDRPQNLPASVAGAVFAILAAMLLVRLAVGVSRVERWSRSPLVVLQILFLPVAYTLAFPAQLPLVGLPVGALCVTVLYLTFTPEGRLAFFNR